MPMIVTPPAGASGAPSKQLLFFVDSPFIASQQGNMLSNDSSSIGHKYGLSVKRFTLDVFDREPGTMIGVHRFRDGFLSASAAR
jgi:hypothetical protein